MQYKLVDGYIQSQTRERGEMKAVGGAKIPGNKTRFPRVDENKTAVQLLRCVLHDSFQLADKELVITESYRVWSKPALLDTAVLTSSNQFEVDSHIMLHAAHANNGDPHP